MAIAVQDVFTLENKFKKTLEETLISPIKKQLVLGVLVRVSTDKQADEGDSLEMQQELAQQIAKDKNAIIYEYYIEDGLSAKKVRAEKRKQLQRLKQDIIDGKINGIIAYRRDRMFRNSLEAMQFLSFLIDNDCELFLSARNEIQVNLNEFKGMGKIMEFLLATFNEMESDGTSMRVSDTMISIARKGGRTGGNLPIGYTKLYPSEEIVPIESAIPLIQQIEDMYLAGVGRASIAKWLNGGEISNYPQLFMPVPKPYDKVYKSSSEEWNTSNIATILFNPIYTGHSSYQSKKNSELDRIIVRSEKIKPIRTLERQKEINDLDLKKKANHRPPRFYNTPFLLTGLVYCKECGSKYMTRTTSPNGGVRRSYYACDFKNTRGSVKKTCKHSKNYRKEILESIVLDAVKNALNEFLNGDSYELFHKKAQLIKSGDNNELQILDNKIALKQEEFDNITDIVLSITDKNVQQSYFKKQSEILNTLNQLKETRGILAEKLDLEVEEIYDFDKFIEHAKEFGHIIEYAPIGVQKQLLEGFVNSITIDKDGNISLDLGINIVKKKVEDTIIGLNTIGERIAPKHIIVSSDKDWYIRFNYYDILTTMYDKAKKALYPFLQYAEPRLAYENHHLIDISELKDYKVTHYTSLEPYRKVNAFMLERYGITKGERLRLMNDTVLPPFKKIKDWFEKLDTSVEEFIEYINDKCNGFLVGGEYILDEIIECYKGKSVTGKYLFENKITCLCCGNDYVGRKSSISSRYLCKNNRPDRKEKRCQTVSVNELVIVKKIKYDLGVESVDKEFIQEKVESVKIDKDGGFEITYKNI